MVEEEVEEDCLWQYGCGEWGGVYEALYIWLRRRCLRTIGYNNMGVRWRCIRHCIYG